jgi:hypothetical protein
MRIVYVGNFEPEWSTENDVRKAFEYLGHEVIQVQESDPLALQKLHALLNLAVQFDMFLITSTWDEALDLRGMLDFYKQCADKGIPTVTYHLDVFWGSDRGDRRWWLNPMFRTAYVFTASNDWQKEWHSVGVNHQWLRPAVRHDAAHFGTFREEYACDVAFLGSNGIGYHESAWPYRKQLVDFLRDMCARNGWTWRNPGGELDKPNAGKVERGEDRNDFYASAKVTVGDSLCLKYENSQYCSDRVYEATGCGGFLIMPQLDFLEKDFNGSLPMYPWGNFEALEKLVRYYLAADDDYRREIVKTNQAISAKDHTYVNRVQTIMERVGLR